MRFATFPHAKAVRLVTLRHSTRPVLISLVVAAAAVAFAGCTSGGASEGMSSSTSASVSSQAPQTSTTTDTSSTSSESTDATDPDSTDPDATDPDSTDPDSTDQADPDATDDPDADHPGGDDDEEPGGPQAPADYLDRKYSSNRPVTLAQVRRGIRQADALSSTPGRWRLVGPTNIGGRLTEVAADPRHKGTVYVAASGGGIWRSTDYGVSFRSVWPARLTQTIGSLAIGSDGTIWVGTGEANPSGGGLTFFGTGVYRSGDGGRHWHFAGLGDSGAIGKLVVDPANPRRVWAAASGSLSGATTQRGIYRWTPGRHWVRVLGTPNNTTGGIDIAVDPSDSRRVYASLWDHKRNNGARVYGGVGSGLFRTVDRGAHWTRLQHVIGTASTDKAGTGLRADPSLGRIGVAVAPSRPNRVYVITGTQYGLDKGFYVSNDGGSTFRPGGHAGGDSGYQWWFGRVWVDPHDADHLFAADVTLRESTDGGRTWHYSQGQHADQHGMAWDPFDRHRVFLANDGGMYHSGHDGHTNTWFHARYQPWNQSYHLAVAADAPRRLATGLQDNGSVRTWTDDAPPTNLHDWNAFGGGDGHEVLIDYANHDIYYECYQVGNCTRHHDVGGTDHFQPLGKNHSTRITTDAPIVLDPSNHHVLYFGGNRLDRSTDGGRTFTAISPPGNYLTGPVPPDETDRGPFYGGLYGTITWIAPSRTRPRTIYVGTDTGNLWRTTDLGRHWHEFSHRLLPTRWVNSIVVDPHNALHVMVAYSGYREGDRSAAVWQTTNGGRTWHNISGLLPNAPVEMLSYDAAHRRLYAATDLGLFTAHTGSRTWRRVGHGLPNTPIFDVKLTGDGRTLYVATFGRSVWKLPALQQ